MKVVNGPLRTLLKICLSIGVLIVCLDRAPISERYRDSTVYFYVIRRALEAVSNTHNSTSFPSRALPLARCKMGVGSVIYYIIHFQELRAIIQWYIGAK